MYTADKSLTEGPCEGWEPCLGSEGVHSSGQRGEQERCSGAHGVAQHHDAAVPPRDGRQPVPPALEPFVAPCGICGDYRTVTTTRLLTSIGTHHCHPCKTACPRLIQRCLGAGMWVLCGSGTRLEEMTVCMGQQQILGLYFCGHASP